MKSQWFFICINAMIMAQAFADNTTTDEYYDPTSDAHQLFLWKELFVKINTLLLEAETMNSNIKDLNKKIDDISKRQEEQEKQMQKLNENVELNTKSINEGCLKAQTMQEDDKTRLNNLVTTLQENSNLLNATTVALTQKVALSPAVKENPEWITILRRKDGSVDFFRKWAEYKVGFGNPPDGEFFIGLEKLHELTSQGDPQELQIVLRDWKNEERSAHYDLFQIGGEDEKYKLKMLGTYSGDALDAMAYHKGMQFSTSDQDNDGSSSDNCAKRWQGAWWFNNCYYSHLSGPYKQEKDSATKGVSWMQWKGHDYSLKFAEMKIRSKTSN